MQTNISYDGKNSGFQPGVVHGNIENVTFVQSIVQSDTLNQECLRDLHVTDPSFDKERIKSAKGGLFEDSYRWILDNEEFKQWQDRQRNCLLWIRGDPGKGKTMLLCGIIEELARLYGDNANISFFFCQATDMRINSATSVLRGLIYLLAKKHLSLLRHVRARYDHAGKTLFEDVNAWNALSAIFRDILNDSTVQMTYLVIDALDECTNGLCSLLDLIVEESSANRQIKWVVSSRNRLDIIERLDGASKIVPISLELNEKSVSEAVNRFICRKVRELARTKGYTDNTHDAIQRYLMSNSQGTFLWVALVCQNLGRIQISPLKKLQLFPPGLGALYSRMFDQVCESEDPQLCKQILATISTVYRPITLIELDSLIKGRIDDYDDLDTLSKIITICGSFLTLRKDTIAFVHQSAKDFLLQKTPTEILPRGIESEHHAIFSQCLDVLLRTLRRDIFNIKAPGFPANDVIIPSPNPLAPAEYACIYWADHLHASKRDETSRLSQDQQGLVVKFLQQIYPHWLETLSILKGLSDGIRAMKKLEALSQETGESNGLSERVRDAARFIQYHRTGIECSPLQVYCSPLVFSPSNSLTRVTFHKERPDWVLNEPKVHEEWSPCIQTLEGHRGFVSSLVWSPDGSRLASGSHDNTVCIWDPATGQSVSMLEGHSGPINSIAWSPDGSRLASGSDDNTVSIWNLTTGQSVSMLKGHSGPVNSIAWLPDGSQLASGSDDNTVSIWNLTTGQSVSMLKGHNGPVNSIAWLPDGSQLASGSDDNTVRIWDPATGQSMSILKGHSGPVNSIAWLPDGSRLTSGSSDNTVGIWNPATGQSLSMLEGHSNWVQSVAWSPDGSRLASGSSDSTVRIWDPATGQSVSMLEGHSGPINSIAWSPDGSRLTSGSHDNTVGIWNPATGQSVFTLEEQSDSVSSIAWSPDGSRLASGSSDSTVSIWNPATGQSIFTLKGHSDWVLLIVWSPDGSRLASASYDNTVRIWNPATGQSIFTLEGHSHSVLSIAWSPDGSQLASASYDNTVRIWNLATGQSVFTLEGHSDSVLSITWSPDGSRLVSASYDNTVRVWDPATGRSELNLEGQIHSVQFDDNDSNLLHTDVGTFDTSLMALVTPVTDSITQPPKPCGYGFSNDHSWITYNGLKILWLPPEYRPISVSHFALHATTIAIACSSNRIIFLAFPKQFPVSRA